VEQSIGVFGQDVILWAALLRQTPRRPEPHQVHQHANYLLDELKRSREAQALPIQSVDDGMFAIAALIDEIAMTLPDLRPYWSQALLQAMRFSTNNAGVELFERLHRVRQGPRSVLATYATVMGLRFMGCYGLPGADRYALAQLRRDLAIQLGVDPDRDWTGGVLKPINVAEVERLELFKLPWYKSLWLGRTLAAFFFLGALAALLVVVLVRGA
jgi:type VI secretion system protein ImpK